jgi:hypothetical protein
VKTIRIQTLFARVLVVGFVVLTLSLAAAATSPERKGKLHLVKETSEYTGLPGSFATITFSNLAEIPVGSKIFYDQAVDVPTGLLDSNIVLDAGNGNRAVGRCTTDLVTWIGLCTFSDGTGTMAGFHARLDVSLKSLELGTFDLRGSYGFTQHGSK